MNKTLDFAIIEKNINKDLRQKNRLGPYIIESINLAMGKKNRSKRYHYFINSMLEHRKASYKLIDALEEAYSIIKASHYSKPKNTTRKQEKGEMILTKRQLAARVGVSSATAEKALLILRKLGIIKVARIIQLKSGQNGMYVYRTLLSNSKKIKKDLVNIFNKAKSSHYKLKNKNLIDYFRIFNTRNKRLDNMTMNELQRGLIREEKIQISVDSNGKTNYSYHDDNFSINNIEEALNDTIKDLQTKEEQERKYEDFLSDIRNVFL